MPDVSIPLVLGHGRTCARRKKHTPLKIDLYFSPFSWEEHYVDRVLWLVSNLNIISMSQTRTHTVKLNECTAYTITD